MLDCWSRYYVVDRKTLVDGIRKDPKLILVLNLATHQLLR